MEHCLEVDSVIKEFGEKTVLADVYLHCRPGEIIGLFGRNGTGKSTLLKIIFGTLKAERSFIRINGKVMKRFPFRSGLLSYLPQHPYLPPHLTVPQVIDLYLNKNIRKPFLADPYLFKIRKQSIGDLSGGEQRYLEIKLLLYAPAPYVLLDEPFSVLSPVASEAIREHIRICSREKGIILTDHNYREVHKIVNRIYLIHDCYLKEIEDPRELIPFGYYAE